MIDDELIFEFREEANDLIEAIHAKLDSFLSDENQQESLNFIYRAIHTIKGGSSMFEMVETNELCHTLESYISSVRGQTETFDQEFIIEVRKKVEKISELLNSNSEGAEAQPSQPDFHVSNLNVNQINIHSKNKLGQNNDLPNDISDSEKDLPEPQPAEEQKKSKGGENTEKREVIRVASDKVNQTLNGVWEVFLVRNQMKYLFENYRQQLTDVPEFCRHWELLDHSLRRNIGDLERSVMSMRMVPIQGLFLRMKRVIDQYCLSSNKKIQFVATGEQTEIDKTVSDNLAEPLVHLIRNAMDHGVESPEERKNKGKDARGLVRLSATVLGNEIVISVTDDGKGIDAQSILESAQKKGLDCSFVETTEDALQLIFSPGFSTASQLTEVSGRGVGMDAVKTSIERLGGKVSLSTEVGRGTQFSVRIPLSLSMVSAILIEVNGAAFAVNRDDLVEARQVTRDCFKYNGRYEYMKFRDRYIPALDLERLFVKDQNELDLHLIRSVSSTCIVREKDRFFALKASRLLGNTEIVVKPMPAWSASSPFLGGVCILADGRPAFVLSLRKMAQAYFNFAEEKGDKLVSSL